MANVSCDPVHSPTAVIQREVPATNSQGQRHICITVFISSPHGQVHRHLARIPGTPRAPWPCSRPGRGWPPGGRRPGSASGCPDTKQIQREKCHRDP